MFPEWRGNLQAVDRVDRYITAQDARNRLFEYMPVIHEFTTDTKLPWKILSKMSSSSLLPAEVAEIMKHKSYLHIIVDGFQDPIFESAEEEWEQRNRTERQREELTKMLDTYDEPKEAEPVKDIEHEMYRVNRVTYHDGHCEYKIMEGRALNGVPIEDSFEEYEHHSNFSELKEAIDCCNSLMNNVIINEDKAYTPLLATAKKEHDGDTSWGEF